MRSTQNDHNFSEMVAATTWIRAVRALDRAFQSIARRNHFRDESLKIAKIDLYVSNAICIHRESGILAFNIRENRRR